MEASVRPGNGSSNARPRFILVTSWLCAAVGFGTMLQVEAADIVLPPQSFSAAGGPSFSVAIPGLPTLPYPIKSWTQSIRGTYSGTVFISYVTQANKPYLAPFFTLSASIQVSGGSSSLLNLEGTGPLFFPGDCQDPNGCASFSFAGNIGLGAPSIQFFRSVFGPPAEPITRLDVATTVGVGLNNDVVSLGSPNASVTGSVQYTVTPLDECPLASINPPDPDALTGDYLRPPFVNSTFYGLVRSFMNAVSATAPDLTITSGYRPFAYQQHFLDIRNQYVRYWKLSDDERTSCADLYKQVTDEISQHVLKGCDPTKGCDLIPGQPLVSVRSAHSVPPESGGAVAVDIQPSSKLEAIGANALATYGLVRPYTSDPPHVEWALAPAATYFLPTLSIFIDPPFNVLVTDPAGRRLGIDPSTGSLVNEIGQFAFYSGRDTDVQFVDIADALPGRYTVTPVQVGTGPYKVVMSQLSEEAEILEQLSFSGVARGEGSVTPFEVVVPYRLRIDIKPDDTLNTVNSRNQGKIGVAILSGELFDAVSQIKRETLTFGKTGTERSLASCHSEDVNNDLVPDLMCHFYTQTAGFTPGDTTGLLRGEVVGGTPLIGSDAIRIIK